MRVFCFILISLVFLSCNRGNKTYLDESNTSFYFDKGDLEIRNFVDLPEYINLDQSGDYFFTQVDKLLISDNFIFVLDLTGTHYVYVYNRNGKFISRIGVVGDGPNEYRRLGDFFVTKSEEVILLDRQKKKLLFYNPTGKLIQIKSFDFRADSFIRTENGFLFGLVAESEVDDLVGYQVIQTDFDLNVLNKFQKYPLDFHDVKFNVGLFTHTNDFIYYHKPVTDQILKFDLKGNLIQEISLLYNNPDEFEEFKNDYGQLSELRSAKNFKYLNSPPFILGDLVIGQGYDGDSKAMFLYDTKSGNYNILSIKAWNFNHLNVNFPYFSDGEKFVASILEYELYLVDWGKGELPENVSSHISDGGVTVILYYKK